MPEICKSCNHPHADHKTGWWRNRCRPLKGVDSGKCSCKQYVEDEDQLTQSELIAKMNKDMAEFDARLKEQAKRMEETYQSLKDEIQRNLRSPK